MVLTLALALVVAACGSDESSSGDGSTTARGGGGGDYKIAFLSQGPTNAWSTQFDAIGRKAGEENEKISQLDYYPSGGDADRQVSQFQDALVKQPDAIVLVPMGKAALTASVERATAQDIPVILCTNSVDTDAYATMVGIDLPANAQHMARWLVDRMGRRGTLLLVDGIAGVEISEVLTGAIKDEVAKYPDIKVVGDTYADFSVSKAKSVTETVLASGKKIDGAWGVGGETVTGILQAFADAGETPPPTGGSSANNGALRLAVENDVDTSMFHFPATMSAACMDAAVDVLDGREVPKKQDVSELQEGMEPFDGQAANEQLYDPRFTDEYIPYSDRYLTEEELSDMKLVRGS